MIPDEAVEAADAAFWACSADRSKVSMRAALEAAAPHLMAQAWEQGVEDGYHHRPNPYSSAGGRGMSKDDDEFRDASADVAAAFTNREASMRKLVARAAGVDPDIARELGY